MESFFCSQYKVDLSKMIILKSDILVWRYKMLNL